MRRRVSSELIRGTSDSALQGLISGSLDLDKIEYLKRDAFMCGVPYGEIDVHRLTQSMLIVADPETGRRTLGIREKGLSALESLLFAKYQMYRNVYWHHAVRSATAMYKRLVEDALRSGALDAELLPSLTDEGLHSPARARASIAAARCAENPASLQARTRVAGEPARRRIRRVDLSRSRANASGRGRSGAESSTFSPERYCWTFP